MSFAFWCCFVINIVGSSVKSKYFYASLLLTITIFFFGHLVFNGESNNVTARGTNFHVSDSTGKLISLAAAILILVLVEQLFYGLDEEAKWKLKPFCIGISSIFIFDLYILTEDILFNKIDYDASAIRSVIRALVAPLFLISFANRSRNNLKFKLSKNTFFHTVALTLSGCYLVLIAGVGYYVRYSGGEWGRALQVTLIYLSLLLFAVTLFSNSLRSKIKVYIEKNFFQYMFDYREEWLNFTNSLVVKDSILEMENQILIGFSNMLESPSGSLWIKKNEDSAFHQVAQLNQTHTQLSEPCESTFCSFMIRTGWIVDVEQHQKFPDIYSGMKLPEWIYGLPQTWLIFPLLVRDEMIGFCVLDKTNQPFTLNWEVIDLLKTAGRQAAGFLIQMQATESLLETQKFAAFNRMSAFVVHDLKNIITQLSLMMKNSQRLLSNVEFQKDMLLTVDNSLLRMRQLMLQLRQGSAFSTAPSGVNLQIVLERLQDLMAKSGRQFNIRLLSTVISHGQEDRLERILGHLLQNAFEATEEGGQVLITVDKVGHEAHVLLSDSGKGMSPEFLAERFFKPFQTTKANGMGIGAYESYLYIKEIGGRISAESTKNIGTKITICLPLFESNDGDINQLRDTN